MRKFQSNDCMIVGYARMSTGEEKNVNRVQLLQKMVDELREDSLADLIYVSTCSESDKQLHDRDKRLETSVMQQLVCDGSTQGK